MLVGVLILLANFLLGYCLLWCCLCVFILVVLRYWFYFC